jgi:hypothetical protein
MTEAKKKNPLVMWIVVFVLVAGVGLLACAGAGVTLYYVLGPESFSFGGGSGSLGALEKQLREVLDEQKAGGNTKAKEMLKLPESWFVASYGAGPGKELHAKYSARADDIERRFLIDLKIVNTRKLDKFDSSLYDDTANPVHKRTLDSMTAKPKIYQVYAHEAGKEKDGMVLGPFVVVDGTFRFFSGDVPWNQAPIKQ